MQKQSDKLRIAIAAEKLALVATKNSFSVVLLIAG